MSADVTVRLARNIAETMRLARNIAETMSADVTVRLARNIAETQGDSVFDTLTAAWTDHAVRDLAWEARRTGVGIDPAELLRVLDAANSFKRARELELRDVIIDSFGPR